MQSLKGWLKKDQTHNAFTEDQITLISRILKINFDPRPLDAYRKSLLLTKIVDQLEKENRVAYVCKWGDKDWCAAGPHCKVKGKQAERSLFTCVTCHAPTHAGCGEFDEYDKLFCLSCRECHEKLRSDNAAYYMNNTESKESTIQAAIRQITQLATPPGFFPLTSSTIR